MEGGTVKAHQLEGGMTICKHWGFRYATCLVWNKDDLFEVSDFGEILLVYIKGRPKMIFEYFEGSKEKPQMVKDYIENGYPG